MDLHKLRIFATVARLGSFTRAAETLHMTQPTISQQIAVLEQQVGTLLIERQTRRLRLTPAGEALRPYAEQMLTMADAATEATRTAAGLADRTLRLGVGHVLSIYLLPELLRRLRAEQPQFRMRLSFGTSAELLEQVASDTVDMALIGTQAVRPGIAMVPFLRDRLVVVVAPDDPWARRQRVSAADLRDRTLLTREVGSSLYTIVERHLGTAAMHSDEVIQFVETEAIKRGVESGLGVALIQRIAVEREIASGALQPLRFDGDDQRTYAYAFREGRQLSSAAMGLIDLLDAYELARAV